MNLPLGELAALLTAICWAVTASAFEDAGKKIGSMNVNLLRLFPGLLLLSLFTLITRGYFLPFDASAETWFWMLLSGLVGFVIGDLLLFEAFILIGARISMLIYASVPPLSGLLAYLFLGESMTHIQILGMFITLSGISLVILDKKGEGGRFRFRHPLLGILLAFGGAIGQAAGYVIGKHGMGDFDPFAANQIRLIAAIGGFSLIFTLKGKWKDMGRALKEPAKLKSTLTGAVFGPFIGVSLSLYAVQRINPGVASTLMSVTPVLLILHGLIFNKDKIDVKEILGAVITFAGLILLF